MTKDMTEGKLFPLIIRFTIPLVLGNILQLTYNAIDSMIVGKFVGKEALAAVGTSNPIMTLIILLLNGITLGAGILIGTLYGAKDYQKLERQISTAMIAGSLFSILISFVAIIFASPLLHLLQVDQSILPLATLYLRIVMTGLLFTFIYNYFASILRALGDSQSPLYFLAFSALFNIFGDLFFVLILHLGIKGCAYATVVSEGLSALLCFIYIKMKIPVLNLGKKWLIFDFGMLKKTVSYGFVTALQQTTVQVGKLGIQTIVNSMGVIPMATFNVVNRPDDFAIIPEVNIAHAMTAVMAQNNGAGKRERVKESFRIGMVIEIVYGIIVGILFYLCAHPIMSLFTNDQEVIQLGVTYLHLISYMYLFPAITNAIQGYFRGIGDLQITFWSSLINVLGRVISCILLTFYFHQGFLSIPFSYAIGWSAMVIFETPFIIKWYKK